MIQRIVAALLILIALSAPVSQALAVNWHEGPARLAVNWSEGPAHIAANWNSPPPPA